MHQPILKKGKYILGYSVCWVLMTILHTIILVHFYEFGIVISLSEGLIFNVSFAILGIGIWYPVYYSDIEKNKLLNLITNHLAAGSLTICLWIWGGYFVLNSLFSASEGYIHFLTSSIPWRVGWGILLYTIVATNYYLIIYYQNFKEKLYRESELKTLIKESELESLKSQINPHFLFNSLNSISSLSMINSDKAQEMVINLSDFLRYSLSHKKEFLTTLKKELDNIDRYLGIEKIRFGDRLVVRKKINNDCQEKEIPGLILQPLIENAIKYGVYESTESATIEINCSVKDDVLKVSIKNDFDPEAVVKKGEGIGIRNVSGRMKILYNRDDLIIIKKTVNTFEVILSFPQSNT